MPGFGDDIENEFGNFAPATPDNAPVYPEATTSPAPLPYDPSRWDEALGVPGGALTDAPAPLPSLKRVDVSRRGLSPQSRKEVETSFANIDAKNAQLMAPREQQVRETEAKLTGDYDSLALAQRHKDQAEADYHDRMGDLDQRQEDFLFTARATERLAGAHAKQEADGYIAQVKEQLAGVKQLMMMPANPLAQLSGGQGLALGVAQFAQGFLAARYGVHIDVASQVDKWVDRELNEHQRRIENARQGVADTISLYQIARDTSRDETEARQRLRAMGLEAFKAAALVQGDRFQSEVARAKAQEAASKMDIELQTQLDRMHEGVFKENLDNRRALVQEATSHGQLKIESERLAVEKDREERLKQAAGMKSAFYIADPRNVQKDANGKVISGGLVQWKVNPNLPPEDQAKIASAANAAQKTYKIIGDGIDKLKQLSAPLQGKYGPTWWKKMTSEEYRVWKRQADDIVQPMRHAVTGAQVNDFEKKEWDEKLETDKLFQSGSNLGDSIIQLQDDARIKAEAAISDPNIIEVDAHERQYLPVRTIDPQVKSEYEARFGGGAPITTPVNQELSKLEARGSKQTDTAGVSPAYLDFMKSSGDVEGLGSVEKPDSEEAHRESGKERKEQLRPGYGDVGETRAIAAVDHLASIYHGGDEHDAAAAADSLQRIAQGNTSSDVASRYAQFVLKHLDQGDANYFAGRVSGDDLDALYDNRTSQQADEAARRETERSAAHGH